MKKNVIFLLLLLLTCGLYAQIPQKVKVQPRMSYFTTAEEQVEIIITSIAEPKATIKKKSVALTKTREGMNRDFPATVYSLPMSRLVQGDNVISVTVDGNKYEVHLTVLPAKENGVQIDYLTGMIHVDGLPFMANGFYCYSPVQHTLAEEEVVRGFNLMSPYQNIGGQPREERIAYLDRAAKLGMKVNYNLLSIAGGGGGASSASTDKAEKQQLLREEIRAVKNHPAILSWYVADEPEGQGISVETLEEVYAIVKEEDPYHPISIVIMSAGPGREYAHTCDIIMTDPYPVPNSPARDVFDAVRGLQHELIYEKALWYVAQTFGGAEWWAREPSPAEIRMMAWGAALEGARGFQAFIRHGLNGFPKDQYMWSTYAKTCREIQELTPFIDRGKVITPRYSGTDLIVRQYTLDGQNVLVALNTAPDPNSFTVTLDLPFHGFGYNLSDNSREEFRNGTISSTLPPYGVKVLKIFTDEAEEAVFTGNHRPVNPSNLLVDPSFEWQYSVSSNVPAAVYGKVGKDRGATFTIDSRVAYHGTHSLRMINPAYDQGAAIQFFPPPIKIGTHYIMSVWARTDERSLKNNPSGKMTFKMDLGGFATQEFELTSEWKRYELSATYKDPLRNWAINCALQLIGEGTAWFDLVEVVADMDFTVSPLGDDPTAFRVILNNNVTGGKIHYTLDGTEPTQASPVYDPDKPLILRSVHTVKARVYGPDGTVYGLSEQQVAAHKAIGATVKYLQPYTKYDGGGDSALVDGRVADLRLHDQAWQGFINNDMEIIIDMHKPVDIRKITSQYYHSKNDWIMPPLSVEYFISEDGKNFESLGNIELGEAHDLPNHKVPVVRDNIARTAQYVKLIARKHQRMPSWHSKDAVWMFIDEVIIE